jgi:AcrR family transcriptional regulator
VPFSAPSQPEEQFGFSVEEAVSVSQDRTRPLRTRAVTESAKLARRGSLLSAAGSLFASRDFNDVSVDAIAKKAGLAKGTVYLYFGTKEALFLHLVSEELAAWLKEATRRLKKNGVGPLAAAAAVASTLSRRPALIRLLALLHAVLERNSEANSLRTFKGRLLEITTESAALFESALSLAPGAGVRLTLWMHALIVGLAQMTATSPILTEVLAEDDTLAVFRLDFRAELESALLTLFAGAKDRFRSPTAKSLQMQSDQKR